jgi:hypothetical protein
MVEVNYAVDLRDRMLEKYGEEHCSEVILHSDGTWVGVTFVSPDWFQSDFLDSDEEVEAWFATILGGK